MSELAQWAGGVIVGGFDGTTLPEVVRDRLGQGHLGGVTLFKRNIVDPTQTAGLCAAIADAGPSDLSPIVSIDQEGGRVARLGAPVLQLPPMRVLGRIDDAGLTRRVARALAEQLAAIGINLDFAPVADVDSNPANPVIGDRAFGSDPSLVSEHVVAFIEGLRDGGVLACAKHFPGHGDTAKDSHLDLPSLPHGLERLRQVELLPFAEYAKAGLASVMTAHVIFDALDPGVPATMSTRVMDGLLRKELGFQGVVVSDDLEMKAIADHFTVERAVVEGMKAGVDCFLVCHHADVQRRAIEALVKAIESGEVKRDRLEEARGRMAALTRRFVHGPEDLLSTLGTPAHEALRRGLSVETFTGKDPTEVVHS
jgi:beta-N-acetylhexosaminidase